MASEALFQMLAQALSQPSHAYRAATEALAIPGNAASGYMEGSEIADKINQRRMARQTLSQTLGGSMPEGTEGFGNLTVAQADRLARPLTAMAALRKANREVPEKEPATLESILAGKVSRGEMTMDHAAEIKRSMTPSSNVKPPMGYRFDESGNLVAIPGGPADTKLKATEAKQRGLMADQLDKSRFVLSKIDNALAGVGPMTTGVPGAIFKHVPGTSATNLNKTLDTVRANVGFETLQAMRANSPTGGALGQVSDRENQLLQSVRGNLDQEQSMDQLVSNLRELRTHYANVVLAMESQTGDPEADDAIAKVIASQAPDTEKRARIAGIRGAAGAQ